LPYAMTFHAEGLPSDGIDPREFSEWDLD
jgi:hypothetical protein